MFHDKNVREPLFSKTESAPPPSRTKKMMSDEDDSCDDQSQQFSDSSSEANQLEDDQKNDSQDQLHIDIYKDPRHIHNQDGKPMKKIKDTQRQTYLKDSDSSSEIFTKYCQQFCKNHLERWNINQFCLEHTRFSIDKENNNVFSVPLALFKLKEGIGQQFKDFEKHKQVQRIQTDVPFNRLSASLTMTDKLEKTQSYSSCPADKLMMIHDIDHHTFYCHTKFSKIFFQFLFVEDQIILMLTEWKLVTFASAQEEEQTFMINFLESKMPMTKESYFCKQITFFNKKFVRQVLVEFIPFDKMGIKLNEQGKSQFFLSQMQSFNVSTLSWKQSDKNHLYFFKRFYEDKLNEDLESKEPQKSSYLQLMRVDLNLIHDMNNHLVDIITPIKDVRIEDDDYWYSNVHFSQEIGPKTCQAFSNISNCETGSEPVITFSDEKEFLNNQFILLQKYQVTNTRGQSKGKQAEELKIRIQSLKNSEKFESQDEFSTNVIAVYHIEEKCPQGDVNKETTFIIQDQQTIRRLPFYAEKCVSDIEPNHAGDHKTQLDDKSDYSNMNQPSSPTKKQEQQILQNIQRFIAKGADSVSLSKNIWHYVFKTVNKKKEEEEIVETSSQGLLRYYNTPSIINQVKLVQLKLTEGEMEQTNVYFYVEEQNTIVIVYPIFNDKLEQLRIKDMIQNKFDIPTQDSYSTVYHQLQDRPIQFTSGQPTDRLTKMFIDQTANKEDLKRSVKFDQENSIFFLGMNKIQQILVIMNSQPDFSQIPVNERLIVLSMHNHNNSACNSKNMCNIELGRSPAQDKNLDNYVKKLKIPSQYSDNNPMQQKQIQSFKKSININVDKKRDNCNHCFDRDQFTESLQTMDMTEITPPIQDQKYFPIKIYVFEQSKNRSLSERNSKKKTEQPQGRVMDHWWIKVYSLRELDSCSQDNDIHSPELKLNWYQHFVKDNKELYIFIFELDFTNSLGEHLKYYFKVEKTLEELEDLQFQKTQNNKRLINVKDNLQFITKDKKLVEVSIETIFSVNNQSQKDQDGSITQILGSNNNRVSVKLTFPKCPDSSASPTFIVYLMQIMDRKGYIHSELVVYDLITSKFQFLEVQVRNANFYLQSRDQRDFLNAIIVQTSDFMSEVSEFNYDISCQATFSLINFFNNEVGLIKVRDFVIEKSHDQIEIKLIGLKHILFSNSFIKENNSELMSNFSFAVPLYHERKKEWKTKSTGKISKYKTYSKIQSMSSMQLKQQNASFEVSQRKMIDGFNLILFTGLYQSEVGQQDLKVIQLNFSQHQRNQLYHFKSDILLFGGVKIQFDLRHGIDNYAMVYSVRLKSEAIKNIHLNNNEALYILEKSAKKQLSMHLTDLQYIFTNPYEKLINHKFFQNMDILQGNSLCDISLQNYEDVVVACKSYEMATVQERGDSQTALRCLTQQDSFRQRLLNQCDFIDDVRLLNYNWNFKSTINLAINLQASQSIKVILDYIFKINEYPEYYYDLIMMDLVEIIQYKDLQIDQFFTSPNPEDLFFNEKQICNFERTLTSYRLPQYSSQEQVVNWLPDANIFDDVRENELNQKIIEQNKLNKTSSKEVYNFKVEHCYINLSIIQLSCKLQQQNKNLKTYQKMNGLALAQLINLKVRLHQFDFFKFKVIQEIINLQWKQAKKVMLGLFVVFFFFYFIPIIMITTNHSNATGLIKEKQIDGDKRFATVYEDTLIKMCVATKLFLFTVKMIQFKQIGMLYFKNQWNIVDLFDLIAFFLYVTHLKYNQLFSAEAYNNGTTVTAKGNSQQPVNKGSNNNSLFKDFTAELRFVIVLFAFLKFLYFVRQIEKMGFIVRMIFTCLKTLVPFIMVFILALMFFTFELIVLNNDIDSEVKDAKNISFFQQALLQTFRTSIGELGMPMYDQLSEPTLSNQINIYMIWFTWYTQCFFNLVVMLNFIIAVINAAYEAVKEHQLSITYAHRADFNYEAYQILNQLTKLKPFTVILASKKKDDDAGQLNQDSIVEMVKLTLGQQGQFQQQKNQKIQKQLAQVNHHQKHLREIMQEISKRDIQANIMKKIRTEIKQKMQHKMTEKMNDTIQKNIGNQMQRTLTTKQNAIDRSEEEVNPPNRSQSQQLSKAIKMSPTPSPEFPQRQDNKEETLMINAEKVEHASNNDSVDGMKEAASQKEDQEQSVEMSASYSHKSQKTTNQNKDFEERLAQLEASIRDEFKGKLEQLSKETRPVIQPKATEETRDNAKMLHWQKKLMDQQSIAQQQMQEKIELLQDDLQTVKNKHQEELLLVTEQFAAQTAMVKEMQKEIRNQNRVIKKLQNQLEDSDMKFKVYQKNQEHLRQQVEVMSQNLEAQTSRIQLRTATLESEEQASSNHPDQQVQNLQIASLNNQLNLQKQQMDQQQKAMEQQRKQIDKLMNENNDIKKFYKKQLNEIQGQIQRIEPNPMEMLSVPSQGPKPFRMVTPQQVKHKDTRAKSKGRSGRQFEYDSQPEMSHYSQIFSYDNTINDQAQPHTSYTPMTTKKIMEIHSPQPFDSTFEVKTANEHQFFSPKLDKFDRRNISFPTHLTQDARDHSTEERKSQIRQKDEQRQKKKQRHQ